MNTDITFVYHLGALNTDNDQLMWSLRKDNDALTECGTMVRRPTSYRRPIRNMVSDLAGDRPSVAEQETLLNTILGNNKTDRYIMSNDKFLGGPTWTFYGGRLYKNAIRNTSALRNLFPDNPCEFFLGIVNPASFIPAAFNMQSEKDYHGFMGGTDLASVHWSEIITGIKEANPGCPITVWCNEDTPIIWPTVLREIAGLDPQARLAGEQDVINEIMSDEGENMLAKYLDEHPDLLEAQRCKVRGAFLEKFFLDEAIEEVADLPGWTEETVEALTDLYEDDIERIEQIPGVNFLSI